MNSQPFVSICCITYNQARYIRQCIDGFLSQQTNFSFEIIINDDCSTDGTIGIIKEYAERYPETIKPIFHIENQFRKGINGMFRSFCFPVAYGKYVALCEGDDYWDDPLKLQKQIDFLESHSDYSMCFTRSRVLLEVNTTCYLNCFDTEDRDYSATELFDNWIVPTASIVMRQDVKEELINWDKRLINGDIVFVERAAHMGKIRGMSDYTCVYRIQNKGVTYDAKQSLSRIKSYPEHFECIKEWFPMIDSNVICKTLAKSYYERAILQTENELKRKDFMMADKYVPGYCKTMKIQNLKSYFKKFLHKLLS